MKIKVENKFTILSDTLKEFFGDKGGIYLDTLRPIKIKKHGRRAKSLFEYGLNHIANLLFRNDIDKFNQCCKFLSCT